MATISPTYAGSLDPTTTSDDDSSVSLIYAFLPPLVRRSMPKVRSLRRSLNSYTNYASHSRASSSDGLTSGQNTPPPAYHEALAPLTAVLSDTELLLSDEFSASSGKRASFQENGDSGIQWKYASQGLNLLTQSAQESSLPISDASFSRSLYIDAATYILRGVPNNLTDQELLSLQAATPSKLIHPPTPANQLPSREGGLRDADADPITPDHDEPTTLLHRAVSAAVFQLFILFSLLWPYVQVLARTAYDFERQHRISERFATTTWSTANAIGKTTMSTVNGVCTWNDGQVGETLESMVTWWVQGVAGGLCEGVGEGIEVLGVKPGRGTTTTAAAGPRRRKMSRRQTRA